MENIQRERGERRIEKKKNLVESQEEKTPIKEENKNQEHVAHVVNKHVETDFSLEKEENKASTDPETQNSENENVYIRQAKSLIGKKKFSEALVSLEKCLSLNSNKSYAYMYKGIALANLGRDKEAFKSFEDMIALKINAGLGYMHKGLALEQFGRHEKAIECFNEVISLKPYWEKAYYQKGVNLWALKRPEEAMENFDKVLEMSPKYKWAHYRKGEIYLAQEKYTKAIDCFKDAINPSGVCKHEKNVTKSAENDKKSVVLAEVYYLKGVALSNFGMCKEAIKSFDRALSFRSDYRWANFRKGQCYTSQKMWKEAISCFNDELALLPHADDYKNDRVAINLLGDDDHSSSCKAFSLEGLILTAYGKHSKATQSLNKALSLKPDCVQAYVQKGKNILILQRPDEAIKCFEQARALKPDLNIFPLLEDPLISQEMSREIIKRYEEGSQKENHSNADLKKKIDLKNLEMTNQALQDYEKELLINPKDLRPYFNKARLLYKLNRKEETLATFDKMISLNPPHDASNFNQEGSFKINIRILRKKLRMLFGWDAPKETRKCIKILKKVYGESLIEKINNVHEDQFISPFHQLKTSESSKELPAIHAIHSHNNEVSKESSGKDFYAFNPAPCSEEQSNMDHYFFRMDEDYASKEDIQELAPVDENSGTCSFPGKDNTSTLSME